MKVYSWKILLFTLVIATIYGGINYNDITTLNISVFEALELISAIGLGLFVSLTEIGYERYLFEKDIQDIALIKAYGKKGKKLLWGGYVFLLLGFITIHFWVWGGSIFLILGLIYHVGIRHFLRKAYLDEKKRYFK